MTLSVSMEEANMAAISTLYVYMYPGVAELEAKQEPKQAFVCACKHVPGISEMEASQSLSLSLEEAHMTTMIIA